MRERRKAIECAQLALRRVAELGLDPSGSDDAIEVIREVEALRRTAEAVAVDALAAVDRTGAYAPDGHVSAKTMVRHYAKLSAGTAAGRAKEAKVCAALPEVAKRFRCGRFGVEQLQLLARVHSNPRVRDRMPEFEEWFIKQHDRHRFVDFERLVRRWEKLADEDGAVPRAQRIHERRTARFNNEFDGSWKLDGAFGSMQGAQMAELFEYWVQAEWHADWDKAKAEHGEEATADHLPRTAAQRRADALVQIFQDAAACPDGAVPPGFVHNIVWDAGTFEEMASRAVDDTHADQPLDVDTMTCRTLDGVDLDHNEAIASAIRSRIRRVLIDAKSVATDLGEARFFTGSSRLAVLLSSPICTWPGCEVPASQCECDHIHDHTDGGRTCPGNGAPACGRHNRWKQKGFTVHRNNDGTFTILRPDGTPIPPA